LTIKKEHRPLLVYIDTKFSEDSWRLCLFLGKYKLAEAILEGTSNNQTSDLIEEINTWIESHKNKLKRNE
jgi:hypothetical protein